METGARLNLNIASFIGEHYIWKIGALAFHADTLIMCWIASGILLTITLLVRLNLRERRIGWVQSAAEVTVEALMGMTESQLGKRAKTFFPLVATLFLFIITCNWLEAIPFNQLYDLLLKPIIGRPHGLELSAPTSDLNTTAALALIVFVVSLGAGIMIRRAKYFRHFIEPIFVFLPINLMEEVSKPFSLAIRLFANIFSKVIILLLLVELLAFPLGYPVPLTILSLFIGSIQAFIFALLASFYIGMAINEEH